MEVKGTAAESSDRSTRDCLKIWPNRQNWNPWQIQNRKRYIQNDYWLIHFRHLSYSLLFTDLVSTDEAPTVLPGTLLHMGNTAHINGHLLAWMSLPVAPDFHLLNLAYVPKDFFLHQRYFHWDYLSFCCPRCCFPKCQSSLSVYSSQQAFIEPPECARHCSKFWGIH